MKTIVEIQDGRIVLSFQVTDSYTTVIQLSPNEARNFKAQLEAALKALAQGDED